MARGPMATGQTAVVRRRGCSGEAGGAQVELFSLMAKVRCPCGRHYQVAEKLVGRRVRCAACNRTFVATPAAPPLASTRRMRVGELALAAGLLTRDQLRTCLEYQRAIRRIPTQDDRRLGQILVRERLLTRRQLDGLLQRQLKATAAEVAASVELPRRRVPRRKPITEEQRAAIRRGVEAAARQQAEREEETAELSRWDFLDKVRAPHVLAALALVVAVAVVVAAWPAPRPARVLAAYLASCSDERPAPDASLAAADLGLAVSEFGELEPGRTTTHDYTAELASFSREQGSGWGELLARVDIAEGKRRALELALRILPDDPGPKELRHLEVAVAPVACHLVFHRRGMGLKMEGRYRFWMVRVRAGAFRSGWRVAALEPLPGSG